jgi:hypothetical protein
MRIKFHSENIREETTGEQGIDWRSEIDLAE